MKRRKCDLIIKSKGCYTKVYINGKWQKGITHLEFIADIMQDHSVKRVLDFECYKKKNGRYVIENDRLVKEKHRIETVHKLY